MPFRPHITLTSDMLARGASILRDCGVSSRHAETVAQFLFTEMLDVAGTDGIPEDSRRLSDSAIMTSLVYYIRAMYDKRKTPLPRSWLLHHLFLKTSEDRAAEFINQAVKTFCLEHMIEKE